MKKNKIGVVGKNPAFAVNEYGMVFNAALLPNVSGVRVQSNAPGNLIITWIDNSYRKMAEPFDIVFFSVFEEISNTWVDVTDAALRMDAICLLDASCFKGQEVEIFITVCSEDGTIFSDPLILKKIRVRK